ncbi:hypothetical protein HMSSN139_32010 [Paenibacillus sp. HMSSN-139]|nr:hypothetical protein HMSSN139_32010 [Paenibacillus sp. HMSSN-139]
MAKSAAAAKKPMGLRMKQFFIDFGRQWEIQSMIWPGIIFMIIFCYVPIYGLTIAFKNYTVIDTLSSAPWVGLDNFKIIASDKYFWDSVVNTLGISFLKLAIGFVIPIILAIMIYELSMGRFKKSCRPSLICRTSCPGSYSAVC